MAVTINADNGVSSGSAGLKQTADSTGVLALQTNGTTAVTVDASQNVGIGSTTVIGKTQINVGDITPTSTSANMNGFVVSNGNTGNGLSFGAADTGGYNWISSGYVNSASSGRPLAIFTAGTERMRIDSSGNVGIGTSSPSALLHAASGSNGTLNYQTGTWAAKIFQQNDASANNGLIVGNRYASDASTVFEAGSLYGSSTAWGSFYKITGGGTHIWGVGNSGTESMRLESSGLFKFNSGYGSAATAYGCRAWVNFNGVTTATIQASGNVTSVTRSATGNYTVNFTTAMPDANYACTGTCEGNGETISVSTKTGRTTSAMPLIVVRMSGGANVQSDNASINVAVLR